jgi:predicted nucleic acid-binding protein
VVYLLDTSALIAHYRQEPGWEQVQAIFEGLENERRRDEQNYEVKSEANDIQEEKLRRTDIQKERDRQKDITVAYIQQRGRSKN